MHRLAEARALLAEGAPLGLEHPHRVADFDVAPADLALVVSQGGDVVPGVQPHVRVHLVGRLVFQPRVRGRVVGCDQPREHRQPGGAVVRLRPLPDDALERAAEAVHDAQHVAVLAYVIFFGYVGHQLRVLLIAGAPEGRGGEALVRLHQPHVAADLRHEPAVHGHHVFHAGRLERVHVGFAAADLDEDQQPGLTYEGDVRLVAAARRGDDQALPLQLRPVALRHLVVLEEGPDLGGGVALRLGAVRQLGPLRVLLEQLLKAPPRAGLRRRHAPLAHADRISTRAGNWPCRGRGGCSAGPRWPCAGCTAPSSCARCTAGTGGAP